MKFINNFFLLFVSYFALFSCSEDTKSTVAQITPSEGEWRMTLDLGKKRLPFNFTLYKVSDSWEMTLKNAEEEILVDQIKQVHDSLLIDLPIFESSFFLKIIDSTTLEGVWINYYKSKDYQLPAKAEFGIKERFKRDSTSDFASLAKRYKTVFAKETNAPFDAIALFEQKGNILYGTFATETGDYRYLEGIVHNDSLFLSTFDGSHAYLFEAFIKNDTLFGKFWSGSHYEVSWIAVPDPIFELRNPDSLTFIKPEYDQINFSLPDLNNALVSLNDEKFKNKVIIVQLLGSWCPNCLDETKYLNTLYERYKADGLEIVGLAFERTKSKAKAIENLQALIRRTNLNYTLLLGGSTRDESPEEVLPMLNHVMSFPTTIFIDKNKNVRKIHTGFYGPGTGDYYTQFKKETEAFVELLLK